MDTRRCWKSTKCDQNSFPQAGRKRLPRVADPMHTRCWEKGSLRKVVRRWSRQRKINQHHDSKHSHKQCGRMETRARYRQFTRRRRKQAHGDTDDRSSALLGNSDEVIEEGPPPLEGQRIQNAVEASPPGPPGFLLPLVFTELPRLCVLYRPQFGSKSSCVVPKFAAVYSVATWCLADGYSLHVFLHSLVVAFGHR